MGLSASQTRYLSLTARKSNVEFQGQQINEARTVLANQSADLFTQMMNLKAPTAPTLYDYVINPATLPDIDWENDASWPLANAADQNNFIIYYSANQPSFQSFNIPEYVQQKDSETGETYWCQLTYDKDRKPVYGDQHYSSLDKLDNTLYCVKKTGYDFQGTEVSYMDLHVPSTADFTYDNKSGVFAVKDGIAYDSLPKNILAYNTAINAYNTYSKPTRYAVYENALTEEEKEKIKNSNTQDDGDAVGYKNSATVNYNQAQYDAAMVQYEKDKKEYENAMAEINAKTDDIQQSDKKLELQLKQLDTEQEAINTEMEAVKKVIDKNIEQTFKSFA